ncbi:hypothetical protein [Mesorhizobium sp.]|uniref:hypothetical protein n=1 Tax=Mesorhizobium sp. TaxID=1871066 RepID=UPI003BAD6272
MSGEVGTGGGDGSVDVPGAALGAFGEVTPAGEPMAEVGVLSMTSGVGAWLVLRLRGLSTGGDISRAAAAADIPAIRISVAITDRFKEASYVKEALSVDVLCGAGASAEKRRPRDRGCITFK